MGAQAWVLAHQGGWDEALMVLAPMLVFFGLLWVANRKAAKHSPPTGPSPRPGEPGPD